MKREVPKLIDGGKREERKGRKIRKKEEAQVGRR
jgi:hypothetical protein